MTDEHRNETESTPRRGRCGLGRGARFGIVAGALLLLGAIAGGAATVAFNASANGWHRGWGHHGNHGAFDVDEFKERAANRIGWWLETVDATAEQERAASEIVDGLIDKVYPLAEEHRANRQAMVAALTRDQVDREVLETIRRAELELADVVSGEVVTALSEVAEVLTPEQRQRLVEKAKRFRH